jgi:hypothetical protein
MMPFKTRTRTRWFAPTTTCDPLVAMIPRSLNLALRYLDAEASIHPCFPPQLTSAPGETLRFAAYLRWSKPGAPNSILHRPKINIQIDPRQIPWMRNQSGTIRAQLLLRLYHCAAPHRTAYENLCRPANLSIQLTMEPPTDQKQRPRPTSPVKPPRKRKRIVISCTECHRRKQKVLPVNGFQPWASTDFESVIAHPLALTALHETNSPYATTKTSLPENNNC